MYRLNYYEEKKEKDTTYDDAYYSCLNNNNSKWQQYYFYLKEKNDLCYNVKSITIDTSDIKKMKFECFSNDILLKLYLICANNSTLDKYSRVNIVNNCMFAEELIYNILKSEWLINEKLLEENDFILERQRNYFIAMIEASETRQDIKIQFRNKLFEYFIKNYDEYKSGRRLFEGECKILKLNKE